MCGEEMNTWTLRSLFSHDYASFAQLLELDSFHSQLFDVEMIMSSGRRIH